MPPRQGAGGSRGAILLLIANRMRACLPYPVRRSWAWAASWFHARTDELRHCRECGHEVAPLDEICGHCGVIGPARVNISATLGIVALASIAFLLML